MKLIAQSIPGLTEIFKCNPVNNQGCSSPILPNPGPASLGKLGDVLSLALNLGLYAAVFLAFLFLVWGALAYITSQGQKENLAKARARLTWAIVGLIVVILAFFIAKFVGEVFMPKGGLPF